MYQGPSSWVGAGWVTASRIFLITEDSIFARDLIDGELQAPELLTGALAVSLVTVAGDRHALALTAPSDAGTIPYVLALEAGGGPPRPIGDAGLGPTIRFLPSGRRIAYTVGAPSGTRFFAVDADALDPEPFLIRESADLADIEFGVIASADDRLLALEDPPDGPALLWHADLSGDGPYAVEQALDGTVPIDAIGVVRWAPVPP